MIGKNEFSKGDEYSRIYKGLEDIGVLDYDYFEHLRGKDGYEMASQAEKLTFQECCTVLTFLLRAERFAEGAFTHALEEGTVYNILKRAVDVMS